MSERKEAAIFDSHWEQFVFHKNDILFKETQPIFICSHDIARQLKLQGFKEIIEYDYSLQPEDFSNNIAEYLLSRQSDVNKTITIVDFINWEEGKSELLYNDQQLCNLFTKMYFLIFKKIINNYTNYNYLLLYHPTNYFVGLVEGMATSIAKETTKLKFKSILCDAVKWQDLDEIINQCLRSTNPILKLEEEKIFQLSFTKTNNLSPKFPNKLLGNNKNYLITGNGKIAKVLAKYLSENYGSKLVMLGRKELNQDDLLEIRNVGIDSYIKVDVSNLSELTEVWNYCQAKYKNINGIFHLAGCTRDKLFQSKNFDDFTEVLYPKVQYTMNLDKISSQSVLDFFVCFSSLSGLIGNIGQSDYAAANCFLKHWATHRNQLVQAGQRNGSTFCIDWGLWENGGMKLDLDQNDLLPMSDNEALEAMEVVLDNNLKHSVVFKGNISIIDPIKAAYESTSSSNLTTDKFNDKSYNSAELFLEVITWVRKSVIKFTKLNNLDNTDSILSFGVDSVATINIINDLEKDLRQLKDEIRIIKTIIFDYSTIEKLSKYLIDNYSSELNQLLRKHDYQVKNNLSKLSTNAKSNKTFLNTNIQNDTQSKADDIAIVGIAGRFPKAKNIEEFWKNIINYNNCIEVIPIDRWDWRKDYDPDPKSKGLSYGRHGGFLESIKQFDPLFFNISPSDAEKLDPQERLILENVYHAIEDGCFLTDSLEDTGVFVSIMYGHYTLYNPGDYVIDSSYASVANRISYFFNFKGPSIAIDTMCSGSLTALHMACMSIRNNECDNAVVGAVNLMPNPVKYRLLSQGRFLSASGKCHSFGKNADGYVPGEGVVTLFLKKLESAEKNHDKIYGIIRGSALGSGGRSAGYTIPSSEAQSKVIQKALENSNIPPESISYVETHGTGTSLGDPIEIQGLTSGFGINLKNNCAIGSVKSNIGHLESAAGLAGIIKVLLQFKYKTIAPTINFEPENPLLDLHNTPFFLAKKAMEWLPTAGYPRRAGVSSFGAGGSNAHIVLEEPKSILEEQKIALPIYILAISTKSSESLKGLVESYKKWLLDDNSDLYSISYSSTCGRQHFKYRLSIIYSSIEEITTELEKILQLNSWEQYKTQVQPLSTEIKNLIEQLTLTNPDEYISIIQKISHAYCQGYNIQWGEIYQHRSVIKLPDYYFERKQYWSKEFEDAINLSNLSNTKNQQLASDTRSETSENIHYFTVDWHEHLLSINKKPHNDTNFLLFSFRNSITNQCKFNNAQRILIENFDLEQYTKNVDYTVSQQVRNDALKIIFDFTNYTAFSFDDICKYFFTIFKITSNKGSYFDFIFIINQAKSIEDIYFHSFEGFLKSLVLENTKIKAKVLIFSEIPNDLDTLIINELNNFPTPYEGVLYRENKRCIKSYKQSNLLTNDSPLIFKNFGVYVISGGLGKIGQLIAKYLIQAFKAKVILLGSSVLDDTKKNILSELVLVGGQVLYKQVDISSYKESEECIRSIITEFGNINGIIHAAGRLKDGLFLSKSFEDFTDVTDVKIKGAINLDKATNNQKLDFFVLFSSIASIYGNAGQTDYAMGNAFLDSFAQLRQEMVRTNIRTGNTISINWPLWADGGMQISQDEIKFIYEQQGMLPITNQEGVLAFIASLQSFAYKNLSQVIVLKGNLDKIYNYTKSKSEQINTDNVTIEQDKQNNLGYAIKEIEKTISYFVTEITKISHHQLDPETGFGEYGFDSVSLQLLSDKIKNKYKLEVPPSAFFTINSIYKISKYLVEELYKRKDLLNELAFDLTISSQDIPFNKLSKLNIDEKSSNNQNNSSYSLISTLENYSYPYIKMSNISKKYYAVVGINGLLPGAATLEEFWQNMVNQTNVIKPITRWQNRKYFGGIIPQMDHFDPKFFGLSAREAMLMDPQHRLFLQIAYNTILDGGYNPKSINNVGVFVGIQFNDYQVLLQQWKQSRHPYAATGNAHAMVANRLSYLLNFNGPSQTIDTACSSTLIALKRATMALDQHECDFALVGGVSLMIDHEVTDAAKSMGVLSPNYRCATFDEGADGYVRGEGVGCVLLKRAEDAERDGDHCYGLIVSCAENHGGRSHSLTAPNPEAQKALLVKAYQEQELARQVSYIEAHGTGTKLGDPIEIDALKAAWRELGISDNTQPVAIGSVKTNIGHLEPAAGIASLLKVLLCIQHKTLPTNLHFKKLNPYIELKDSPFYVLAENQPWESRGLRLAGISSFGFGGSNAHIVVQEPPARETKSGVNKKAYLVCISAKNLWSLNQFKIKLAEKLETITPEDREYSLANIAYTLNIGRSHFEYRWVYVVNNINDLKVQIAQDLPEIAEIKNQGILKQTLVSHDQEHDYLNQLINWSKLYLQGYDLPWEDLHQNESKLRLSLPTYQFFSQPFWFENAADSPSLNEVLDV
jgi:polyketide synthase PksM